MSLFAGLNSNVHRCDTWAQVEKNAAYGRYFTSVRLRITGENLWVLSDPRGLLYGHRDAFANWVIDQQDARKKRYMEESIRESWDDITFIVVRNGNALIAIQRDGTVHVNEPARTGTRSAADAIRRLEPIYKDLFERLPNHYLIKFENESVSHGGIMPNAK